MKISIEATQDELSAKSEELVRSISALLSESNPDLSESLEKSIPPKEKDLKFPVLRELQKQTNELYREQMSAMLKDISSVLDEAQKPSFFKKSESPEEESPDYSKEIREKEQDKYDEVKKLMYGFGYKPKDFEEGGRWYGASTNELIDFLEKIQG